MRDNRAVAARPLAVQLRLLAPGLGRPRAIAADAFQPVVGWHCQSCLSPVLVLGAGVMATLLPCLTLG